MSTLNLPIKLGRTYVRRDGKICTIKEANGEHMFVENFYAVYASTGKYFQDGGKSQFDIIKEVLSVEVLVDASKYILDAECDSIAEEDISGPHQHAESMRLYAEDAALFAEPWLKWETRRKPNPDEVHPLPWMLSIGHPVWANHAEYRRAPKPTLVNINGFMVPRPWDTTMILGQRYFIADTGTRNSYGAIWGGSESDLFYLSQRVCHRTEEDAKLHVKAMLSFM